MKVHITINGNSFEVEGEFGLDENFQTALRSWLNHQATGDNTAQRLEDMKTDLDQSTKGLQQAMQDATPPAPVEPSPQA